MERKAKWRDHVKVTPYISPLQTFSSNVVNQEAKQKLFHCPVCLGRYLEQEERPKKLPCNHVVCLLCYQNIKAEGVNHCPICQVQHKFIKHNLSFDSKSDVTNNNVSSFGSSPSLNLSKTSLERQRNQTDILTESNHCHEHSFKKLDFYCRFHDIRICSQCERDEHNSDDCTIISCKQEMKGRKLKAGKSIDSKVHLMTKLNSRITEFHDTLRQEDPRNSQDVEDQISAVNGLLEQVKVKQIFLSDAKREIETQENWEKVLSACEDADLKLWYIDNSLKDMYTKLEAIRLHYTVRHQIGYGETSFNDNDEKLEHEELERSSKNKSKATENKENSELFLCNIQKNEQQIIKEQEKGIIVNTSIWPDQTDGSKSKIKNEKQSQISQKKNDQSKKTNHENSQQRISSTTNDIAKSVLQDDPKYKVNYSDKATTLAEYESCDVRQEADGLRNMTNKANKTFKKSFENESCPYEKYKLLNKDSQKFHQAINIKCIDDNNEVNLGVFDEAINIFKNKNESNDITYDTGNSVINSTNAIESKILLKKLLSDTKRQKDLKMSEVNKLTVCLFTMFILSSIFYFMFARENNIIKDELRKVLSQKEDLETHISKALIQKEDLEIHIRNSLLEINALQQKVDETISQRDFFHLKLNEALIMQGRKSEIQELPQIQHKETTWYSWTGALVYYLFYFIFSLLMLTGSFIILSVGGEKINEDYLSLNISDNINRSISMVVCFLILYEVCGIVTWMTNLQLVASPLFNWYQSGNLFIVDGIRMFFLQSFAYSGVVKWLSTAIVGIIVLALSVYVMSEISEKMKSHGVDKQNHDAFFILTWPILAVAVSVFLVWLSFLPIT